MFSKVGTTLPYPTPMARTMFFFFNFFFKLSTGVQLIYNAVLISTGQKCDSGIHICTLFFILISIMVYHWVLNVVPCAL